MYGLFLGLFCVVAHSKSQPGAGPGLGPAGNRSQNVQDHTAPGQAFGCKFTNKPAGIWLKTHRLTCDLQVIDPQVRSFPGPGPGFSLIFTC